jgi:hypothetical protein
MNFWYDKSFFICEVLYLKLNGVFFMISLGQMNDDRKKDFSKQCLPSVKLIRANIFEEIFESLA